MWEEAAKRPFSERPTFRTRSGFPAFLALSAARENFRGSFKSSSRKAIARVLGSSRKYSRKSAASRSSSFPEETKPLRPMERSWARVRMSVADPAALGDQRHASRNDPFHFQPADKGRRDSIMGVDDPDTVRSYDPNPGAPRKVFQLLLLRSSRTAPSRHIRR